MSDENEAFARAEDVASREYMTDHLEAKEFVMTTAPCGPGLKVVQTPDAGEDSAFTSLLEKYGWYVSNYHSLDPCDHIVVMPLPEVEQ